ncbi:uncharacterized protein L201_004269 [Kwoniella dendrophila CBS 6074]|uniref:SCA7 domain-containing protein n=1 Tax=Kwoniella dendrophila CBS 6074 TaxID=1295534 RepID=A0AAX4JVE8_9TREE
MSYYKPSTLIAATSADLHPIPEASSSRLPLPPVAEEGVNGQGKEKKVKKLTVEDMERLAGQICNVRPLGACQRAQPAGSLYCVNHSCQALNADGDRCGNWVANPRNSRFCANGWHMENSRHTHLSDLLNYRNTLNRQQSTERERANAAQLYYIEQRFPSSSSSSTSSESSTSPSSLRNNSSFSPRIRTISEKKSNNANGERGWGAYGVDAWWRGNWGLNTESNSTTQIRRNSS